MCFNVIYIVGTTICQRVALDLILLFAWVIIAQLHNCHKICLNRSLQDFLILIFQNEHRFSDD